MDESKITIHQPYNPLDKRNIGQSIVKAMLETNPEPLPPKPFIAAGVYAIYYKGDNRLYRELGGDRPIYVGKAVPAGARKGNIGTAENQGKVLFNRLSEHSDSINAAQNLVVDDFTCRYIAVDDIWIPLAETLLIDMFKPVWNVAVTDSATTTRAKDATNSNARHGTPSTPAGRGPNACRQTKGEKKT